MPYTCEVTLECQNGGVLTAGNECSCPCECAEVWSETTVCFGGEECRNGTLSSVDLQARCSTEREVASGPVSFHERLAASVGMMLFLICVLW